MSDDIVTSSRTLAVAHCHKTSLNNFHHPLTLLTLTVAMTALCEPTTGRESYRHVLSMLMWLTHERTTSISWLVWLVSCRLRDGTSI